MAGIMQTDAQVHHLLNMLLIMGDEQLSMLHEKPVVSPVTGMPYRDYDPVIYGKHIKKSRLLAHESHINAVMMAIKPGILMICCKKYNQKMISDYFEQVKNRDIKKGNSWLS